MSKELEGKITTILQEVRFTEEPIDPDYIKEKKRILALIEESNREAKVISEFNTWVVNRYDGGFSEDVIKEYLLERKRGHNE